MYSHVNRLVCCGADANVMMVLFGEKGDTGERKLDSSAVSTTALCDSVLVVLSIFD